jgi:hypothetical protein
MAEHARIVRQPSGELQFVPGGTGQCFAGGELIASGTTVPFDFATQFLVAGVPVPNTHPAPCLMLMQRGALPPTAGSLTVGRDPAQAQIVIVHKNVSARHATFQFTPLSVVDHQSTAGTWLMARRLAPEQPQGLEPHAVIGVGAVLCRCTCCNNYPRH